MFLERFFILDHNRTRSFNNVIFLFFFVISWSSLVESRKFTRAFFKNSMSIESKKFNVIIDSWTWLSNECSWICFIAEFIFFEILRCRTRLKYWSWHVLSRRSTARRDWFRMTRDFCIIIMNKHTRSSYLRKQDHQSFISRWIFSRFTRFFFSSLDVLENDVDWITHLDFETLSRSMCISWNAIKIEAFFNHALFEKEKFIDWNSRSTSSTRFNNRLI